MKFGGGYGGNRSPKTRLRRCWIACARSAWFEQRQTFRPRGARLLRAELRQHGISADLATAASDELVDSAEDDAYRAAQKRARTLPAADEQRFKSRLSQFLARRGFNWDTIASVVERLWRETTDAF
jgi:regulatory protein